MKSKHNRFKQSLKKISKNDDTTRKKNKTHKNVIFESMDIKERDPFFDMFRSWF